MARPSGAPSACTPVPEPSTPARSETTLRVESKLHQSGYNSLREVACDECDGALRLRGSLPSQYLKQMALATAAAIAGERRIVNEIRVVVPSRRVIPALANAPSPRWGWTTEPTLDFVHVAETIR